MATTISKTQCFECKKETRTFNCGGCVKDFCLTCLTQHVQALGQELDHDQFRQTLIQHTNEYLTTIESQLNEIARGLNEEFNKPMNILLKQQSTPFIDKMVIIIPFHRGNLMRIFLVGI